VFLVGHPLVNPEFPCKAFVFAVSFFSFWRKVLLAILVQYEI